MKSPLALDKQTVAKYKIVPEIEPTPLQKLAFLENQLQEIKAMQFRSRIDIIHATRLSEDSNEVLKNKGLQNLGQHNNEVQQATGAALMIIQLIDELRAEYPELAIEE